GLLRVARMTELALAPQAPGGSARMPTDRSAWTPQEPGRSGWSPTGGSAGTPQEPGRSGWTIGQAAPTPLLCRERGEVVPRHGRMRGCRGSNATSSVVEEGEHGRGGEAECDREGQGGARFGEAGGEGAGGPADGGAAAAQGGVGEGELAVDAGGAPGVAGELGVAAQHPFQAGDPVGPAGDVVGAAPADAD